MLQLRLLGTPEINLAGQPVAGALSNKALAILAYLAVTGQPQTRAVLATLLWGDLPESAARMNLRKALAGLRQELDPYLQIERHVVAFKPEITLWVDAVAFETGIKAASAPVNAERLQAAVDLYRGDFLAGFYVRNAPDFEAWMLSEQARLRELVVQVLHTMAVHFTEHGELSRGIAALQQLLNLEPWREEAHHRLMLLLAQDGQRAAALAQYEICRRVLAEELGVEPGWETVALYERIRDGKVSRGAEAQGSRGAEERRSGGDILSPAPARSLLEGLPPRSPAPSPPRSPTFQDNLPQQPTPFVGRAKELADIIRRLTDRDCRLLTLIGPGGIGKTRLALQTAQTFVETGAAEDFFPHGLIFASLVGVGSTRDLVPAVAEAVKFSFFSGMPPRQQLLDHLQDKKLLLILDNLEHVLAGGTELITDILGAAPAVKILVTSREALNLQEAWFHPVYGMPFPSAEPQAAAIDKVDVQVTNPSLERPSLEGYDAVRLFVQSAGRARVDFSLAAEQAHVVRICQLVEGMPLALELAAAWLKVLPVEKIAREIERNLDFLTTRYQNVPERHHSIRAVFEHSWQLLTADERAVLERLAVFRGSFTEEAARRVTAASLPILAVLVEKSLLRVTETGRYTLHELLRQFAAEKLLARVDPVETSAYRQPVSALAVWRRYGTYYLHLAGQREASLKGSTPQPALTELQADLDNIRQAWQWATVTAQIEEIKGALGGLARFYDLTSLFEEGAAVFGQTANDLQDYSGALDKDTKQAIQQLVVKLWVEQARLLNRRGLSGQALQVIPRAAELAHQIQDIALAALAHHQWGETLSFHGHAVDAQARLEEALRLARMAGLGIIEAEALRHIGISRMYGGDIAGALNFYQESLACFRRLNDRRGEGMALNSVAHLKRGMGQLIEAETEYRQAFRIFQEIDYRWGQDMVLNNLGNLRYDLGDYSQAQTLCLQGLQICAEINDHWGESHLLNSLGNIMREQGDFSTAQSYYEQALSLWRKIGARLYEGETLAELALLWHLMGRHEMAYNYSQQAELIAQDVGSLEIRALALTYLGHAQVELGYWLEAAESYGQALTLRRKIKQFHFAREALAGLTRVALGQDHPAQAQAYAAELLPQLEIENLYGAREPFRVYLTGYQFLQADHDPRAAEILTTAHRLLQARADAIEDERLRCSFLENLPAHRTIVELATRLG